MQAAPLTMVSEGPSNQHLKPYIKTISKSLADLFLWRCKKLPLYFYFSCFISQDKLLAFCITVSIVLMLSSPPCSCQDKPSLFISVELQWFPVSIGEKPQLRPHLANVCPQLCFPAPLPQIYNSVLLRELRSMFSPGDGKC